MNQIVKNTIGSQQRQGADTSFLCHALEDIKKTYGIKLYLQKNNKGWEACAIGPEGKAYMLLPSAPSLTSLTHLCRLVSEDNTCSPELGGAA